MVKGDTNFGVIFLLSIAQPCQDFDLLLSRLKLIRYNKWAVDVGFISFCFFYFLDNFICLFFCLCNHIFFQGAEVINVLGESHIVKKSDQLQITTRQLGESFPFSKLRITHKTAPWNNFIFELIIYIKALKLFLTHCSLTQLEMRVRNMLTTVQA